jgi:hypothetical protein
MAKPKITKEQTTPGTPEWFWYKMEREQSNSMLRFLVEGGFLPPGVDSEDVLSTCKKRYPDGRGHSVTTVDEKLLLKLLGTGKLPDDGIRDVLVHGSAYAVMGLNKKRPDLLPVEKVEPFIRKEALELVQSHFVQGRQNDKRLLAFIRWLERVPGLAEVVTVHQVHAL